MLAILEISHENVCCKNIPEKLIKKSDFKFQYINLISSYTSYLIYL